MLHALTHSSISPQHRKQITYRGVMSIAHHAARSHSFIYISTTQGANYLLGSDEHCLSHCTLSLIRPYLDNIGRKCNRAASCLFTKELALLWCERQLLEIISSFFFLLSNLGFLFAVPNFTDGFMCPSNSEMKQETNVIAILK